MIRAIDITKIKHCPITIAKVIEPLAGGPQDAPLGASDAPFLPLECPNFPIKNIFLFYSSRPIE